MVLDSAVDQSVRDLLRQRVMLTLLV
jgi:hypothetical protein